MEKKIKYIGKAEGANLHPDYIGVEIYKIEFEGEPITIYVKKGKVIKFGHNAERGNNFWKFEASKEYEEVVNYIEQLSNI